MIYLDNSAIRKPKPEVIETVIDVINNNWYNASSVYENGLEGRRIVERTRELIAKEINCDPDEIILCGSGSEANSLAIDGWLKANKETEFVTTNIEHSSILKNDNASFVVQNKEEFYEILEKLFTDNDFYNQISLTAFYTGLLNHLMNLFV